MQVGILRPSNILRVFQLVVFIKVIMAELLSLWIVAVHTLLDLFQSYIFPRFSWLSVPLEYIVLVMNIHAIWICFQLWEVACLLRNEWLVTIKQYLREITKNLCNKIYWIICNNSYFPIAQGDIRISGGGRSGLLQYDNGDDDWGAICKSEFDDDTASLGCYQLGYKRSSDNFVYS